MDDLSPLPGDDERPEDGHSLICERVKTWCTMLDEQQMLRDVLILEMTARDQGVRGGYAIDLVDVPSRTYEVAFVSLETLCALELLDDGTPDRTSRGARTKAFMHLRESGKSRRGVLAHVGVAEENVAWLRKVYTTAAVEWRRTIVSDDGRREELERGRPKTREATSSTSSEDARRSSGRSGSLGSHSSQSRTAWPRRRRRARRT